MPSEATRCVEAQKPSPTSGNAKNLVAEKQRFYGHAVYFHIMWKKSEKPKELSEHMVKRGEKFSSGTFGSLKVCIKDFDTSLKNEGKHEAKILQNLRHPNLPLFIGVLESASTYSVVTKFHEVSGFVAQNTNTMVQRRLALQWLLQFVTFMVEELVEKI